MNRRVRPGGSPTKLGRRAGLAPYNNSIIKMFNIPLYLESVRRDACVAPVAYNEDQTPCSLMVPETNLCRMLAINV